MKRWLLLLCCCVSFSAMAQRQLDSLVKYRRSSLYSVLIKHSQLKYGTTIDSAFMSIPTPDKFNNHDLAIKSFESSAVKVKRGKKNQEKDAVNAQDITRFFDQHNIAKLLIAKWFNRDSEGNFNMDLIAERGYYDASQLDIRKADNTTLGRARLADAGEELLGKTFILVNDITFLDVADKSKKTGGWLRLGGAIAGALGYTDVESLTNMGASAVEDIAGFRVNISSYLYRLDWNEDLLNQFYNEYWVDPTMEPEVRTANIAKFEELAASDTLLRISYVGKTTTSAGNLSSVTFAAKSDVEQLMKVCTRAIDKSIVELQREYEEFKVNVPIYRINGDGTVDVQIGLKEGINEKSRFDVLMLTEDADGRSYYERVGEIAPVKDRIWDNRFGAAEDAEALAADQNAKQVEGEEVGNVHLEATTFRIVSGANSILPGCLVREARIKRVG